LALKVSILDRDIPVYKNSKSYSFPSLEVLDDGTLICAFREAAKRRFRTHIDPTSKAVLVRSTDNGKSWDPQTKVVIWEEDGCGIQDPSVRRLRDGTLIANFFKWRVGTERDLPDGNRRIRGLDGVHYAWTEGTYVSWSKDGGETWTEPVKVNSPMEDSTATSEPVLELPDGTLLLPVYGQLESDETSRAMVLRSYDGGRTWRDPSTIAYDPLGNIGFFEPALLHLPGSEKIICMLRTHKKPREEYGYYLYQSESEDMGRTWSTPKKTRIWGHPPNLTLLKEGFILCSYGYRRPPYGVRACISTDNGKSWKLESEVILRSDGLDGDLGYPSTVQLTDGTILTSYYFRDRSDITYIALARYRIEES